MKEAFQSTENSFEINIPKDWSRSEVAPLARKHGSNWQVAFTGLEGEHLHILVGSLSPTEFKPSLEDIERYSREYASRYGYTHTKTNVVMVVLNQ